MKIPSSPCRDCPDRYVGCHSECEKYIEYRRQVEKYHKYLKLERGSEAVAAHRPWFHKVRK